MARQFANATADTVQFAIRGPSSATTWGPFTAVAVFAKNVDGTTDTLLSQATSAALRRSAWNINVSNLPLFYNGTANAVAPAGNTLLSTDGWLLAAVSKATGTVAPRFHRFVYKTGVLTSANSATTIANGATAGLGRWWISGAVTVTEWLDADVAAIAYIPRVLTDSEIRRLASGDWSRVIPDALFHVEFPSSGDDIGRARDSSRWKQIQLTVTGTTRAPRADPPGFRFSLTANRR